jgi:hypothetical protein
VDAPKAVDHVTYYNLMAHLGDARRRSPPRAGVSGDHPGPRLDELDGWAEAADEAEVATVLLPRPRP